MNFVYVRTVDGAEWEDLVIYLTKEEAIEVSKKYPTVRVEIFHRSEKGGYVPSYNYYLNGEYIEID